MRTTRGTPLRIFNSPLGSDTRCCKRRMKPKAIRWRRVPASIHSLNSVQQPCCRDKPTDPSISFDLSGQANGKQPYWNWDYKDFAPRFAFAYSPNLDSSFLKKMFGAHGESSIRGGYGIYYDHFGQGVVNSFDREGSLGLTTYLVNPAGVSTTDCVSRFVSLTVLPTGNACPITPGGDPVPELPSAPTGGFPFVPPGNGANGSFAIGWGIDNSMKTPYSHVVDFSITRELRNHFVLELAYVGRFGRRLLQEVDLGAAV